MRKFQARQGDIFFEEISKPPTGKKLSSGVIAYGEVTGHSHQIVSPKFSELDSVVDEKGDIYVRSKIQPITIGHEEHNAIQLPPGKWYHIFRQREYDPLAADRERKVAD
jgi:hypothetical protein